MAKSDQHSRLVRSFSTSAKIAATVATGIAMSVLLGWAFGVDAFTSWGQSLVAMPPGSAVAAVFLGIAVLVVDNKSASLRGLGQIFATAAVLIGFFTIGEHIFSVGIELGETFADSSGPLQQIFSGDLSPNSGLGMALVGLGLLLVSSGSPRAEKIGSAIGALAALIAALALVGYLYDLKALSQLGEYRQIAFNETLVLLLLALGTAFIHADRGVAVLVTQDSAGGSLARRLLPVAIVLPLLLGWLRLEGQRAGLYTSELGLALLALTTTVIFAVLLIRYANLQDREARERQRAEAALVKNEAQLRAIVDNSPAVIYLKDREGRYILVNHRFRELFDLEGGETEGKTDYDLFPKETADSLRANDLEILEHRSPREHEEVAQLPDGEHTYISLKFPLFGPSDEIFGICAIATDITERKRTEEEIKVQRDRLEELNEEIKAFSYSVSHDLRAPANKMAGFSELLLSEYDQALDNQGRDYLVRLSRSAEQMNRLIDGMLVLTQVNQAEIMHEQVNLSEIAKETVSSLQSETPTRDVEFVIAEDQVAVGDPRLLRSVVVNLIQNAWKYTADSDHAKIQFGSTAENGMRVFFVKDDGIGFDPSQTGRLFTPFQRLHQDSAIKGSGIGLATVQRIVHRHGGRVWAEGEPSKGAQFFFTLTEEV